MDVACITELQDAQPTLKTCSIVSMAALAELYGFFVDSQPELRRKHGEVVAEIVTTTEGLSDRDFEYLDPTLSVCGC